MTRRSPIGSLVLIGLAVLAIGPQAWSAFRATQYGSDSYFAYRYGYWRGDRARYTPTHRQAQRAHRGRTRPKAGLHVNSLPKGATERVVDGRTYYVAQGSWYLPISGGRYTVVKRPAGADTPGPPADCELVYGGKKPYCYLDGVFYKVDPRGYEATRPEVGVVVPYLPPRAKEVQVGGKPFMTVDGHRFRPVLYKGALGYQVVEVAR